MRFAAENPQIMELYFEGEAPSVSQLVDFLNAQLKHREEIAVEDEELRKLEAHARIS